MDMKGLVGQLAAKLNVSEKQAEEAVDMVMGFVRDKFPDIGRQLDGLVAKIDREGDGLDVDDVKDALGGLFGTQGKIFALASDDGQVLDEIVIDDGVPLAVAVDDLGRQVLVVVADLETERVWLRVFSRRNHQHLIDIPTDDPLLEAAIAGHYHHQLTLNAAQRELTLVSTARVRYFQDTPIEPMVIARWTIAMP